MTDRLHLSQVSGSLGFKHYIGTFTWLLLGNGAKALSQMATLVILVRLTDPRTVGEYGLAYSIAIPFITTANLRLTQLQGTEPEGRFTFGDYVAVRCIAMAASLGVILGILFVTNMPAAMDWLVMAVTIRLTADALLEVFHGLFLLHSEPRLMGMSSGITHLWAFVTFGALMFLGFELPMSLTISALMLLVPLFVFFIPVSRKMVKASNAYDGTPHRQARFYRVTSLLRISAPMGAVVLFESATVHIPRYFLGGYVGTLELGVFVALLALLSAGALFNDAISHTIIRNVSEIVTQRHRSALTALLVKTGSSVVWITLLLVALAWFSGATIVGTVFTPEYAQHVWVIIALCLAFGVQLINRILGLILTSARVIDPNILVGVIMIAVTVVCSRLLIPQWGITGAAFVIVVAGVVQLAFFAGLIYQFLFRTIPHEHRLQ